jgi:hypothetical protein
MKTLGFRARLTLAITVLMVAFAGFFAIYLPIQQRKAADEALAARAASLAHVLSSLAGASVVAEEMGGAEALKADFDKVGAADPLIGYVGVVKPDGALFAHYRRQGLIASEERLLHTGESTITLGDGYIHAAQPLVLDGSVLGTLVVGMSRDSVIAAEQASQQTALWVGGVILALGLGVAWLIGRSIARPILDASRRLHTVASNLVSTAREQEAASAEEAAAVAQTRRSMDTLLESAQQIAQQSSDVLGHAERTARGGQEIAAKIEDLNTMSSKVGEILATIMQVADKADLLALNASLEGTRAGEAGKGFTLVAAEMRRLAENVMESVTSIRAVMKEMREATRAAVDASGQGEEASTSTARSARQIALLTQEQRAATEQVIASMQEMNAVLHHTIEGVQRSTQWARDLGELAEELSAVIGAEQDDDAAGRTRAPATGGAAA